MTTWRVYVGDGVFDDQSSWPAHLRDDAPFQRCGRCGRKTWHIDGFGTEDRMIQPDGYPCGGRFAAADDPL